MALSVSKNKKAYYGRGEEGRGYGCGGRGRLCTYRYTVTTGMSELRSCVKVEVDVLGSRHNKPTVSVDVKQHFNNFNHQNDSCVQEGSNENHFNDSLIVRDKFTRQCPRITTFLDRRGVLWSNEIWPKINRNAHT